MNFSNERPRKELIPTFYNDLRPAVSEIKIELNCPYSYHHKILLVVCNHCPSYALFFLSLHILLTLYPLAIKSLELGALFSLYKCPFSVTKPTEFMSLCYYYSAAVICSTFFVSRRNVLALSAHYITEIVSICSEIVVLHCLRD